MASISLLEAGEEIMKLNGLGHLFSSMHLMKKTINSGNRVSIRGNKIKEGITDHFNDFRFNSSSFS